jgi:hypothetical protein
MRESRAGRARLSKSGDAGVERLRNAEHDVARIDFVRPFADARAGRKIIVDGFAEGLLEPIHVIGVKADDIVQPEHVADEQFVVGIEFDLRRIAFVGEGVHGFTPIFVK